MTEELFDERVEAQLIGTLLYSARSIPIAETLLTPDDFFLLKYSRIYRVLIEAYYEQQKETPDALQPATISQTVIMAKLRHAGEADGLDESELTTIMTNSMDESAAFVPVYADLIKGYSIRRKALEALDNSRNYVFKLNIPHETMLASIQSEVDAIGRSLQIRGAVTMYEAMGEFLDSVEAVHTGERSSFGITTGLDDMDLLLNGMQDSDVLILGGRPGMGKSSVVLSVGLSAARSGAKAALWSGEMNRRAIAMRAAAQTARLSTQMVQRGSMSDAQYAKFVTVSGQISKLPFTIWDTPAITPKQLRHLAIQQKQRSGLDLLLVDYLQLLNGSDYGRDPYQQVTGISKALKELAMELDIPIFAASQLSRAVEQRADKHPVLSDLRESGSIEQDADIVIFVYRDIVYNPATEFPNGMDLIVAKQRNGPTGWVRAYYEATSTAVLNGRTGGFRPTSES